MRRMITEKDVEKLDSIKPSEIEKLGAMQDPKTAKENQVLTADGTGKAVYKTQNTGQRRNYRLGAASWLASEFNDNVDFPGYKYAEITANYIVALSVASLPFYKMSNGTKIYLSAADYILAIKKEKIIIAVKQAAFDKFNSDTAGTSNSRLFSGCGGYISVEP